MLREMYSESEPLKNQRRPSIFKQKTNQELNYKQIQQQKQNLKLSSRQTKKLGSSILNVQMSAFGNSCIHQKKDDLIYSKFFQVYNGLQKKFIPSVKISPLYLIHKIQQSKPYFKDNLVNKQLLFDVILDKNQENISDKNNQNSSIDKQYDQGVKIKNCIASSRPNSEIYKRLSKKFFQNLKNGIDQCMIFLGSENKARIQSSIGNTNNPGMFMIVAIAILDEKYKQNYEKFDIQMSFLEYRNQKMYDLLNYTQNPLKIKQKQSSGKNTKVLQFGQHRVKICTFLQFIKHFKIALFNNKERDFKDMNKMNDKSSHKNDQNNSTFIMKIRIKRYNNQSQMIYQNQTTLIDFQDNISNKNNSKKSNQKIHENNPTQSFSNSSNSRSLFDYLLIEINNSNPYNKQIHYHMVQKNLLLSLIKKYLTKKQHHISLNQNNIMANTNTKTITNKDEQCSQYTGGQIFIINSMTTRKQYYQKNIQIVKHITQCVGLQWQAYVYNRYKFNKYFNYQYSQQIMENLTGHLRTKKYQLYKDFQMAKLYFIEQGKHIINWIRQYKNVIIQYMKYKKDYKYLQNLIIAYQIQLIGNCIKSDNFKDFYTSKIYLALPRQLQIKTESAKQQIKKCLLEIQKIQEKYISIRKKEIQLRKSSAGPPSCLLIKKQSNINKNSVKNTSKVLFQNNLCKFKGLSNFFEPNYEEFNGLQEFLNLRKYILQYFYEIWSKITLTQQRTITEEIIFQEQFNNQTQKLKQKFKEFIENIEKMDDGNIKCGKQQKVIDSNSLSHLISSLNKNTNGFLRFEKNLTESSPFKNNTLRKNKKQKICQNMNILPKIHTFDNKKIKTLSIGEKKRPEPQVFRLLGHINFDNMIINPSGQNK